ncbi:MAG: ChbG/HpnK family deacetylase, partial [Myxococcaceae bacterium]
MAAARGIRLVVNADDLGLHPDIDAGILRAHREGILTSASVLVKGTHAEVAVRRAREQGLALGVHLCLSTRLPPAASEVETVAPDGRMRAT